MAAAKRYTAIAGSAESFSGGLDAASDPRQVDQSCATIMLNAFPGRNGHAIKRSGFSDLTAALGAPVRFVDRLETEDGSYSAWLVCAGSKLFEVTDAGVVSELKVDFDDSKRMARCMWNNRLYISDGVTGLWSYGMSGADSKATLRVNMVGPMTSYAETSMLLGGG